MHVGYFLLFFFFFANMKMHKRVPVPSVTFITASRRWDRNETNRSTRMWLCRWTRVNRVATLKLTSILAWRKKNEEKRKKEKRVAARKTLLLSRRSEPRRHRRIEKRTLVRFFVVRNPQNAKTFPHAFLFPAGRNRCYAPGPARWWAVNATMRFRQRSGPSS